MILIQSSDRDYSTNKVIDWIIYYDNKFCRLNGENEIDDFFYNGKNMYFKYRDVINNHKIVYLDAIKSYWYRRGDWNIKSKKIQTSKNYFVNSTNIFFNMERTSLMKFMNYLLHRKIITKIGNEEDNLINKLIVMDYAKSLGFFVPQTAVICNKAALLDFYRLNSRKIITKAINESIMIELGEKSIYSYTSAFTLKNIDDCPDVFFPTLFQQNIEKFFELRIFYLDGKFFTTAIFSQNDNKTKQDFRNYNFSKPNRTPAFNLPIEIKKKINLLMKKLCLITGSIDMIYSKSGDYVFLEVNPIGQFHQVSYPGNFYIEKEIAKKLCK